jgi:hypothetical protein
MFARVTSLNAGFGGAREFSVSSVRVLLRPSSRLRSVSGLIPHWPPNIASIYSRDFNQAVRLRYSSVSSPLDFDQMERNLESLPRLFHSRFLGLARTKEQ